MTRPIPRLLGLALAIPLLAAGSPQASKPPTTRIQARTLSSAGMATEAAQDRLCEDLKIIQAKLDRLESSLSSATRLHADLREVTVKFKAERATAKTVRVELGRWPAKLSPQLIQLDGRIRAIQADTATLRETLDSRISDLKKGWILVEQDMKRLFGLKPSEGTTRRRPCVSQEANRIKENLGMLGSQALNLGSEIADFAADFEQAQGGGHCGDTVTCEPVDCRSCCDAKFKITAPEGTEEYKQQWADRMNCGFECDAAMAICKAKGLLEILEETSKTSSAIANSIAHNLGG